MPDSVTAASLRRNLRFLIYATVVLYLIVAAAVVIVWMSDRRTAHALCTYRGDLVQRHDQTVAYLSTHPDGIAGVDRATIQASLRNQQRAIDALASLRCPEGSTRG